MFFFHIPRSSTQDIPNSLLATSHARPKSCEISSFITAVRNNDLLRPLCDFMPNPAENAGIDDATVAAPIAPMPLMNFRRVSMRHSPPTLFAAFAPKRSRQ
jgi:hypothetical protein